MKNEELSQSEHSLREVMQNWPKTPGPPKVGLCVCGQLLIFTYYFQELQWLCMACGRQYKQPYRAQDETPESKAKWMALESEFMTHCGSKLIVLGMYREGCDECDKNKDAHIAHATDRDWMECNDAIKWLSDRTGREFRLINGIMAGMLK